MSVYWSGRGFHFHAPVGALVILGVRAFPCSDSLNFACERKGILKLFVECHISLALAVRAHFNNCSGNGYGTFCKYKLYVYAVLEREHISNTPIHSTDCAYRALQHY